ncbi:unannotated protein [freshwater metagenome]|uniref:Unannotated protein n=1 Tax=freshwater metagenome TaxID=449393 RepID=A0A6J7J5E6_9ZZZZ
MWVVLGIRGEQAAVIGRHAPCPIARVDDPPNLRKVVPQRSRVLIELLIRIVDQIERHGFERVAVVLGVLTERQETTVLRIHLEQQPEENPKCELVREVEPFGVHLVVLLDQLLSDCKRKIRDDVVVNLLAQALTKGDSEQRAGLHDLMRGAAVLEGRCGEDQ